MKRLLACMLAVVMVFAFAACTKNEANTGAEDAENTVYQVGLVAKNQTDQFTAWQANEIMAAAKDYPQFEIEMIDGEGDDQKIISAMETFIAKGVNAIIVQPNSSETIVPITNDAYAAGVVVIAMSSVINDENSTCVVSGEYDMGYLLAKYACELLPENAKVVIIEGDVSSACVPLRTDGFKAALDERGDIEILEVANADWDRARAMSLMEDWLTLYDQIDGVLSHDDVMLLGANEAIEAAGRKSEFSFLGGIDGLPEGCKAVKDGVTNASVAQDAPSQAKAALDMVLSTLEGGEQKDVDVPTELIDTENVDKWIAIHEAAGNM